MLAISPAATQAINLALDTASVPDGAGLRLAAGPSTEQGVAIEVAFVTVAAPEDQVIPTGGAADVFVEPAAAELLADQVLDAAPGPDDGITFTLRPQGPSVNGSGPPAD